MPDHEETTGAAPILPPKGAAKTHGSPLGTQDELAILEKKELVKKSQPAQPNKVGRQNKRDGSSRPLYDRRRRGRRRSKPRL